MKPESKKRMALPDYREFSRLARKATLIPVVQPVMADLLTPVSAFLAIAAGEPEAFLFESVERGDQVGRYTFLGARPYMRVQARGQEIEVRRGRRVERLRGNILGVLRDLLGHHQITTADSLPPFTAGAVGYFAYDSVRQ